MLVRFESENEIPVLFNLSCSLDEAIRIVAWHLKLDINTLRFKYEDNTLVIWSQDADR